MKNLIQIANQPTTNNGSLKEGLWTTNLANALNKKELIVSGEECEITINDMQVPVGPIVGIALESVYSSSRARMTIAEFISLVRHFYLIPSQARCSNATPDSTTRVLPTPKSVLNSDEYLSNCISAVADESIAADLEELVKQILFSVSDKTTKNELLHMLGRIANLFVNTDQLEQFQHMQNQEVEIRATLDKLTALNVRDVVRRIDGSLAANVAAADIQEVLKQLPELGYVLINSVFNAAESSIDIVLQQNDSQAAID